VRANSVVSTEVGVVDFSSAIAAKLGATAQQRKRTFQNDASTARDAKDAKESQ